MKMSANLKNEKSRNPSNLGGFGMVPVVGLEPTRCRHQRILSPSRLPIPSHRRTVLVLYNKISKKSRDIFKNVKLKIKNVKLWAGHPHPNNIFRSGP